MNPTVSYFGLFPEFLLLAQGCNQVDTYEFCTEMVCSFEKKKDKISLGSKLLTKLMRDAGNSNGGIYFCVEAANQSDGFL